MLGEKVQKIENELIKPKKTNLYQLDNFERNLVNNSFNLNTNQFIQISASAFLNFQGSILTEF